MKAAAHVGALRELGFTPRQAAFVATVALHGGVCVRRQYAAFTNAQYGQITRDLQQNNRNRRPLTPSMIARRLLLLDVAIARRTARWLTTETEKVQVFTENFRVPSSALPQRTYLPNLPALTLQTQRDTSSRSSPSFSTRPGVIV
jgi:hypothetical protein